MTGSSKEISVCVDGLRHPFGPGDDHFLLPVAPGAAESVSVEVQFKKSESNRSKRLKLEFRRIDSRMDESIASETLSLRQRIEAAYLHELKVEGRPPVSVFKFCHHLAISERDFFSEYASLEVVEAHWWRGMLEQVIAAVESGPEWAQFTARQRMLAFLFAFTTAALEHRSLLLLRLGHVSPLKAVPQWTALEQRYEVFVKELLMHGRLQGEIVSRGPFSAVYPRALRLLLRSVVAFNLKDESAKFERTDAFIEKSVAVLFDLMGRQVLDSGFDLLRFLLPRAPHRV
jgi:hypothetical protein